MDISNMTERAAEIMFYDMCHHFGWQGVIYTRRDVADVWSTLYEEEVTYDYLGDPCITDEQWGKVSRSSNWLTVSAYMESEGCQYLLDAVENARGFLPESRGL